MGLVVTERAGTHQGLRCPLVEHHKEEMMDNCRSDGPDNAHRGFHEQDADPEPLLTYAEASERLGVPVAVLHGWVKRQRIPHIRVARRIVRFEPRALDAFIRGRTVTPE